MEILSTNCCPVIKSGTIVEVLNVLDFPSTNKQFVTLKDLENFTLNHKGHKEDIISTIELTLDTFV